MTWLKSKLQILSICCDMFVFMMHDSFDSGLYKIDTKAFFILNWSKI